MHEFLFKTFKATAASYTQICCALTLDQLLHITPFKCCNKLWCAFTVTTPSEHNNGWWSHLVLQRHDGIVFGRIDVQDVEAILPTQVVGDVGERRAGRLGDSVVDDDHVVFVCRWRRFPTCIFIVALLYFSDLVSGNGAFCTYRRHDQTRVPLKRLSEMENFDCLVVCSKCT